MIKRVLTGTFLLLFLGFGVPSFAATQTAKPIVYASVSPIELVNKPSSYLGKNVKFDATFNKFSTLGLDYKPAMRSSKDYISFLVKRDDVSDHIVPLSELKIFIKRAAAEKLVDLESGDKIEVKGKVFSNALGDAWMDANEVKNLSPKPAKKP